MECRQRDAEAQLAMLSVIKDMGKLLATNCVWLNALMQAGMALHVKKLVHFTVPKWLKSSLPTKVSNYCHEPMLLEFS